MRELEDYLQKDHDAYLEYLCLEASGHLCYECMRTIDKEDMRSVTLIGPLPIYHHTACLHTEAETQRLLEAGLANGTGIVHE